MADEPEKSGQEPNLELPSLLSFGRNRKRRKGEDSPEEPATERTVEEPAVTEDDGPLVADPVPPPSPQPSSGPTSPPRSGLAPSTEKAKRLPPVPPPTARPDAPAQQIPVPPPPLPPPDEPGEVEEPPVITTPEVVEEPPAVEEPRAAVAQPLVEEPQVPEPAAELPTEETTVLPVADPEPPAAVPVDESLGWPVEQPVARDAHEAGDGGPARGGTPLQLPPVSPRIAAVVTGAVIGVLGVILAYFASRGCETVRGVGSCGGFGLLALLLIVAFQVVLGAILLKAWQLSDPTSTSFLGVGLVAVFVLLFLLSSLDSVWMLVVIPVLSALTFLLSWWVTTAFVEVPGSDEARR